MTGFSPQEIRVGTIDGRRFRLVGPITYTGKRDTWEIPKDFRTDYVTIPQLMAWFLSKADHHTPASILHDWFIEEGIPAGLISSRDADGVFRRVLRELGVPVVKRWAMWVAVRWAALLSSVRRPEWHKDLAVLLPLTVLFLPILLPIVGYLYYLLLEYVAQAFCRML